MALIIRVCLQHIMHCFKTEPTADHANLELQCSDSKLTYTLGNAIGTETAHPASSSKGTWLELCSSVHGNVSFCLLYFFVHGSIELEYSHGRSTYSYCMCNICLVCIARFALAMADRCQVVSGLDCVRGLLTIQRCPPHVEAGFGKKLERVKQLSVTLAKLASQHSEVLNNSTQSKLHGKKVLPLCCNCSVFLGFCAMHGARADAKSS